MKADSRTKMVRAVMAGLLSSDMSERELIDAVDYLSRNPPFSFEIHDEIHRILNLMGRNPDNRKPVSRRFESDVRNTAPTIEERLAYNIVQQRRLSKREIAEIMQSVSPKVDFPELRHVQVRELLSEFFRRATYDEVTRFMERLQPHVGGDAYLRGIIRKG